MLMGGEQPYWTWNSGLSRFFQLSDLKFQLRGDVSGDAVVVVTVRKALPVEFLLLDPVLETFCFISDDVSDNSSKHNSTDELSPDIFSLDNVIKKSETLACSRSHIRAINLHSCSLLLAVLSSNATTTKACLLCQEQGKKMSPSNHRFVSQRGGFV